MYKIRPALINIIVSKTQSKNRVLVYDSGVGGLKILSALREQGVIAEYFYFADYKNMPFGEKPVGVLRASILKTIANLVKKLNTKIVLLACNTATSIAIEILRERLPQVTFVGTEPAIKLAQKLGYNKIFLLATPNTIKYNRLVREFSHQLGTNLILSPEPKLAEMIENNFSDLNRLSAYLTSKKAGISQDFDCVVLGCTHYLWLKEEIKAIWGRDCIDGTLGVVNRMKNLVGQNSICKITILTNEKSKQDRLLLACQKLNLGR